ncbi:hypothetical protein [Lacinutrix jangbogonensis]|uniref:hypothetical protein n=1 Tax=Lacinutrix jangbogonensis TaxID=1469557 RepID=UPI00053E72CF|nr:hypothetical protein [Lacinutrix jangbogonensis]
MKRIFYFLACFSFLLFWSSCRQDFDFAPSTGSLEFSKDTVYLDTVFTNIGSSTYNLKVYNRSNNDISIPSIGLERGQTSNYRLNVDGNAGQTFNNVEIQAKDSLFIFIETTIDIEDQTLSDTEFLYTDKINFDAGSNLQSVDLVTLVKDAVFIYPDRDNTTGIIETLTLTVDGQQIETEIQGRELLTSELTFTSQRPYVIFGYATVPSGETLIIDAGARVHFHANSGLLVSENASLQVNGSLSADQDLMENEVVFESDRLEPAFADVPGQWGTIWLFENSVNNIINHATIKNGTVGILSDGNPNAAQDKLTITNSQLYNFGNYGILARNSSIKAENLVVNNAGQSSVALTQGGKYNFTHCTIANYWNNSFRQFPALLVNNFFVDADNVTNVFTSTEAYFNNSIIYGNDNPEFLMDEVLDAAVTFDFKFTNCLVKFSESSSSPSGDNYDFTDTTHYENLMRNQEPDFSAPFANNLFIGDDSAANAKGNATFASQVQQDILGVSRTTSPDLGAYQHITFE